MGKTCDIEIQPVGKGNKIVTGWEKPHNVYLVPEYILIIKDLKTTE